MYVLLRPWKWMQFPRGRVQVEKSQESDYIITNFYSVVSKNLRRIRESMIQNRSVEGLSFQESGNNSQIVKREGRRSEWICVFE